MSNIRGKPANKTSILKSSAYYVATKVCDAAKLLACGLTLLSHKSWRSYASATGIHAF